jgi:hypothetical protein
MVATPLQNPTTSNTQITTVATVAKFASGRTQPGATNWTQELDGIGVYVDTSAAGFTKTPIYVTSLGGYNGGSHWGTTGVTSVYNATEKGFTVYVRFEKGYSDTTITPEQANQKKWHINWFGIEPFLEQSSTDNNLQPSTSAQQTPLPATGKYYRLINKNSNKVLNVAGASKDNGANVIQYTKNGSAANEEWLLEDAGNGSYYLTSKNSNKVLNVAGGGSADGANVIQYQKGNEDNSKWTLQDAGNGYFYVVGKQSGKVLAGKAEGRGQKAEGIYPFS